MTRSLPVALAMAALVAGPGCQQSGGGGGSRTFAPGIMAAEKGDVRLELRAAHWHARRLWVRVHLVNRGHAPAIVERQGILLAYEGLEFPVTSTTTPIPPEIALEPSRPVELDVVFETGTLVASTASLRLRAVRRGAGSEATWIETLELPIPALSNNEQ